MSRKEQEIHSKRGTLQEATNYTSTGYSNSRLRVRSVHPQNPKLSFSAMTIVGNLSRDSAQKLSSFMNVEPQIWLWDILQTRFKAKALQEKVYIEYDKVKADARDRRNMRIESNPDKLTHEEMLWLEQNIINYVEDDGFTRIDLALDFEDDLSNYYTMTDKVVKKTVFYDRDGKPETKYFGVRDSDRSIRIYNKKQERKDNADVEVMSDHLWRIEIELRRDIMDYWNDCLNNLHILRPDQTSPERLSEQAMVYTLIHEEDEWGGLNKRTEYKHKSLIREISPVDLTELTRSALRENEKQLQRQTEFWQTEGKKLF